MDFPAGRKGLPGTRTPTPGRTRAGRGYVSESCRRPAPTDAAPDGTSHGCGGVGVHRAAGPRGGRTTADSIAADALKKPGSNVGDVTGELVPQDPSDEPADELLARVRADHAPASAARGRKRAVPADPHP